MSKQRNTESSSQRLYLRWSIWLVYGALLAVGIPWYWPRESVALFLGVPLWVAVAVFASVLISVFTAWLLQRPWPGESDPEKRGDGR